MRILAIVQGEFGHRKVRNLRAHASSVTNRAGRLLEKEIKRRLHLTSGSVRWSARF